jgi:hypothetical protein
MDKLILTYGALTHRPRPRRNSSVRGSNRAVIVPKLIIQMLLKGRLKHDLSYVPKVLIDLLQWSGVDIGPGNGAL